jgi:hypothetical protein
MPLTKINFRPGLNRENTRYTTEGGWYECDKVRFRQGTPEKIGGWARISANTFLGTCRSLWNWVTLGALNLMGVGTNVKFYIEAGGAYNDITPIRSTTTLTNLTTLAQRTCSLFESLYLTAAAPANVCDPAIYGHAVTRVEVGQALWDDQNNPL